jgi:eukaryotic-like serine/threonine-protein kinase
MQLFGSSQKRPSATVPVRGPADAYLNRRFLGKYAVTKFLGEGSNAHVFLASDPAGRQVVVKRIKDDAAAAPRFRQFFDSEVRSMSRFRHPYICGLIDASADDPLGPCLVLEYIPGHTLEAVLRREKVMPPDRAGRFLGPLAHALYAAQRGGIAHRDLKPANLMVSGYGTDAESVRVMDFGFAGFTSQPHIQLAELTGVGQVFACGTPAYVSPEMVRGDSTDARADIYSVGVMLFEMLTGRLPFEQNSVEALVEAHVKAPPPKFRQIDCGHIPPAVEAVVQIALSKYPSERQQSMKELAEQFGKAVGWDMWTLTAPAGYTDTPPPVGGSAIDLVPLDLAPSDAEANDPSIDQFILSDMFEATLPEKLAAIKLRGFLEDVGGEVAENEPGLVRVRVELPNRKGNGANGEPRSGSRVLAFLSGVMRQPAAPRGKEPIEIELRMQKLDANKVAVRVAFRPVRPYLPSDPVLWGERCEAYYSLLRKFIMPEG